MHEETARFVDAIYSGLEGYVYGATSGGIGDWKQFFFQWPEQRNKLLEWSAAWAPHKNVYMAPSLFSEQKATKDFWKCSNYVWVEFDGNFSLDKFHEAGLQQPHIIVQSSGPGNLHCYWKIHPGATGEEVENLNQRLCRFLGADYSGYDCTQILRPPGTHNHKPGKDVPVVTLSNPEFQPPYPLSWFDGIPEVPKLSVVPTLAGDLVQIEFVYAQYPGIKKAVERILANVTDRSNALMKLAYVCAEQGLEPKMIMSVIAHADLTVRKFIGRSDQWVRYQGCVEKALQKHPKGILTGIEIVGIQEAPADDNPMRLIRAKSLVAKKIEMDWVLEEILSSKGRLIVSGLGGVGKSTFSLDATNCLALGLPVLGIPVEKPQKVLYISLEMGDFSLQKFVSGQHLAYTEQQRDLLEERVMYAALGEPVEFTKPENRAELVKVLKEHQFDGIVVDSLSSMTLESLSEEVPSKQIMGWLSHLQEEMGLWVWIIHHNKKAMSSTNGPSLIDLHGSGIIGQRADSVFILYEDEKLGLTLLPAKTRNSGLDKRGIVFKLTRNQFHQFIYEEYDKQKINVVFPGEAPKPGNGMVM